MPLKFHGTSYLWLASSSIYPYLFLRVLRGLRRVTSSAQKYGTMKTENYIPGLYFFSHFVLVCLSKTISLGFHSRHFSAPGGCRLQRSALWASVVPRSSMLPCCARLASSSKTPGHVSSARAACRCPTPKSNVPGSSDWPSATSEDSSRCGQRRARAA